MRFIPLVLILTVAPVIFSADSLDDRLKNASPEARELMLVWDGKGEHPVDARHAAPRTLHQGSDFKPPATKEEWQGRAKYLREQILVAAGLWPLPEKSERCPLETVIHGKVDRGTYSVEKVFFQSYPGFYVSGLLYRPTGKPGPFPGVLCPHGHHAQGRFTERSPKDIETQIKGGWEKDPVAARDIQQARCVNLAMLGCIVFQYDMVGHADADLVHFPHRKTYWGCEYEMNGLGVFGLQLWDSMRSLDFLESLPDVDKTRLACTGESGGATQTFTLMATDDRLACAAPVCMISAGDHQGGCNCENSALLRVFTDNVEIAATFAPKPFIHPSATGDWTKDFMEKGLPEIKTVYKLFGAEDNVEAMRQKAEHNYNLASREAVYNFFNKHLKLGNPTPITEAKFDAILPPSSMTVFTAEHPRPANAVDAEQLRKYLVESTAKRIDALLPKDAATLQKYREVMGTALKHICVTEIFKPGMVARVADGRDIKRVNYRAHTQTLTTLNGREKVPVIIYLPTKCNGLETILVTPNGKAELVNSDGSLKEPLSSLLEKGHIVTVLDLFDTGESIAKTAAEKPLDYIKDFVAGYNRAALANRVNDLFTVISEERSREGKRALNVIGLGSAGPVCALAVAMTCESARIQRWGALYRVAIDANQFDFDQVKDYSVPNFLPSAARFGGLWPLSGLIAPAELFVFNTGKPEVSPWLKAAYAAAGAPDKLKFAEKAEMKELVEWITR